MQEAQDKSFVFIVGSERSGTTLLGEILHKHKDISQWYEPYFVWDRHFRKYPHDERTAQDATPEVCRQIYTDFINYKQKAGNKIIIDKSPRNSLKIPFIRRIFPHARFIHIIRDGRDVTLSINKEWMRRRSAVYDVQKDNHLNYKNALQVIFRWLSRQPSMKYKLRAFWFETHGHLFNKSKNLHRLRWKGKIGWGPRFEGWQRIYEQSSLLQFNAYQWLNCVDKIMAFWPVIPQDEKLEIRYEELLQKGNKVLTKILDFLEVENDPEFFSRIPQLKTNNFNKWQKEFSDDQLQEIQPILEKKLIELGYAAAQI